MSPGPANDCGFDEFVWMVRNLDEEALRSADRCILEYLLPYVRMSSIDHVEHLNRAREESRIILEDGGFQREALLQQFWKDFTPLRDSIWNSYDNLTRMPPSNRRDTYLADYQHLVNYVDQFGQDLRDSLNRKVGTLSLQESRQSIKEAETVRRLSQLAFVFIPMTFVTSCFGMNLQILGSGLAELSTFLIIASIVTVAALVLPSTYTRLKRFLLTSSRTTTLRIILKLARYLPGAALWMVWFGISHPGDLRSYLEAMGLYRLLHRNDPERRSEFQPPESLKLSPSWHKLGQQVFDFF